MNEKVLTINDREELYDKCENMEQLFDKYYLPLLNIHYEKTYQLQQETQQLKEQLKLYETYLNRFFKINNKSYDGKVVLEQIQQRESAIDEAIDTIDKMIEVGYTKGFTSYFATGRCGEFYCRALIIKEILNKGKGDNNATTENLQKKDT